MQGIGALKGLYQLQAKPYQPGNYFSAFILILETSSQVGVKEICMLWPSAWDKRKKGRQENGSIG